MSVGKIVRKIVRKWMKKANRAKSSRTRELSADGSVSSSVICSEPCMFYANAADGGRNRHGDLNRNLHISDEMRYSKDRAKEECPMGRRRMHPVDSALRLSAADDDDTDVSVDAAAFDSSQSPVPVCVCEACYVVVSSRPSLRLSSGFPPSSRGVTGQSFCGSGSKCRPHPCPARGARLVLFSDKPVKSAAVDEAMDDSASLQVVESNCNENSSASPHLKRTTQGTDPLRSAAVAYHSNTHLPPSVHISMDGEEGFRQSQRRLQFQNHCHRLERKGFCPPPNKTICHVAK